MTPIVVPVGIHRSTSIDGEDLCSCVQCNFCETSCSTANFENLFSRKRSWPLRLAKKTFFRKAHAINRIKLSSGVLIPFKTKRRSGIVRQYKSRYEPNYLEQMSSSGTNQRSLFNPVVYLFRNSF